MARLKYLAMVAFLWLSPFAAFAQSRNSCDQTLWKHVYNPQRLKVVHACFTVTGTIVDASHEKNKDGARHEADGDSHNWLKLDPGQESILLPGNKSTQDGHLVFEIVCHYPDILTTKSAQKDAIPGCKDYKDGITLPPVGSHVTLTGSLIEDLDHKPIHREIHPVMKIEVTP